MNKKTTVQIVHSPPAIAKVEMMSGIRTKEEAAHWAETHGYSTVYWLQKRQRVYADKFTKNVAALAEQLKTTSEQLLKVAEDAQCLF